MATPGQPVPPLPPKKISPWIWILGGLAGIVLLAGIALIGFGLFVAKTIGADAARNPALAAARVIAKMDSNIEIVSSDDGKGTVTIRDKKSGKTTTLNIDQLGKGNIDFEGDGSKVSIDSSGDSITVRTNDGTNVQVGPNASAQLPAWLPSYPGATMQSAFSMQGNAEAGAAVSFATKDAVEKVSSFYQNAFKTAGLSVSANMLSQEGNSSGGMIAGESADKKRSAVINITPGDEGLQVSITYSDKK